MNGLGEQALARPRLTEDQDGGKATGSRLAPKELLDLNPDGGESRAVTDQRSQRHSARILRRFTHHWSNFHHQRPAAHHQRQVGDVPSFRPGIAVAPTKPEHGVGLGDPPTTWWGQAAPFLRLRPSYGALSPEDWPPPVSMRTDAGLVEEERTSRPQHCRRAAHQSRRP